MVTIYDVARRAAVTAATVSNVIRGKGSVGEETRARVLAAIEDLGYRPNLVARGLARGRSYTLALLLPNIANPFYPEIALEVERIAGARGYHLLLCNTHYDAALGQAHLEGLSSRWVDGLLALAGGLQLEHVLATAQRGMPVVLCNWEEDQRTLTLPTVDVDFRYGGELAARHLLDLGHRRCGVIVHWTESPNPSHTRRLDGFRATLEAAGAPLAAANIQHGDSTLESGYRAAAALLDVPTPPRAIFATNDLMALGALEAAIDRGLRVPDDLALIGFDDIVLGAHVRPTLTTIAIPKRDLAMQATELLLRYVDGASNDIAHLAVRPYVVARQTTVARPIALAPDGAALTPSTS